MKMTGAIRKQLAAFLEGFYEIIPKRLISIFTEQELELLISGLPTIDIDDLKGNTEYHKYQVNSIQVTNRRHLHPGDTSIQDTPSYRRHLHPGDTSILETPPSWRHLHTPPSWRHLHPGDTSIQETPPYTSIQEIPPSRSHLHTNRN
uniref:HECT-type E3 ubiquitin transferase n=1 Tax=Callorhinchus milii TaxID=7868 RepID=A0A4W3GRR0_CALMI